MAKIEARGIKKTYDDGTEAVRGIDLTVENGDFLVLLGPSGCGKTTFLRMIAGLETPTEGRILFDGKDVTETTPRKRNTAMVFQNYSLYPDRSIYKNIAFPLESLHTDQEEIDRRVTEAAKMLGITNLLSRRPRNLSGGEKQRVAIARAMVREPSVFLFDEPFANLDPGMRASLRSDILEIRNRTGIPFIYVTHDQTEAMEMGTRIALMKEGKIVQTGTPMDLYRNPENIFAAGFVGRPKINLIETTAVKKADGLHFPVFGKEIVLGENAFSEIPSEGQTLLLGIRPESFSEMKNGRKIASEPKDGAESVSGLKDDAKNASEQERDVLRVRADKVIPEGAGAAVTAAAGGRQLTAVIKGRAPKEGEELILKLPGEGSAHLFDKESGRRLTKPVSVKEVPPAAVYRGAAESRREEEKKSGFGRFASVILNEWWELFMLNLLFLVSCIGIITIPAALTALNRVCIKMEEGEVYVLRRDYWSSFRRDFGRSLLGGAALAAMTALFGYVSLLYAQFAASKSYFLFLGAVMIFLVLLVFMTGMYFFPMNARVDLPAGVLLRNSFLLAVSNARRTAAALLVNLISFGLVGIGLWPHSILFIIAIMFSFTALANVFLVYPAIRQRVIKKE